jgi:cytochrome c biogenesis protein CcmG/thiol:disulfide interchange protein DsbE
MAKNSDYLKSVFILFILSIMVISAGCGNSSAPQTSKPAEPLQITATTIDGKTISLADYKGKKIVLIDLWATWCEPCKAEMPVFQQIYDEYSDQLEIIAASQDDPGQIEKVKSFVESNNLTFPIVHDKDKVFETAFPMSKRGLPYLVVIDREGRKVKEYIGIQKDLKSKIEEHLGLTKAES